MIERAVVWLRLQALGALALAFLLDVGIELPALRHRRRAVGAERFRHETERLHLRRRLEVKRAALPNCVRRQILWH
jgi:hypothetical protein